MTTATLQKIGEILSKVGEANGFSTKQTRPALSRLWRSPEEELFENEASKRRSWRDDLEWLTGLVENIPAENA